MRLMWLAPALGLAVAVGSLGVAQATSVREKQSNSVWRKQDDCEHAAFLKFPDYTPESNANRERATRACEVEHHVPTRTPLTVSPVKRLPDEAAD